MKRAVSVVACFGRSKFRKLVQVAPGERVAVRFLATETCPTSAIIEECPEDLLLWAVKVAGVQQLIETYVPVPAAALIGASLILETIKDGEMLVIEIQRCDKEGLEG